MKSKSLFALAALALIACSGCVNVKPWQRATLSDDIMRADMEPLATAQAEHIWFSREEANGGRGVGGGGCGCN